MRQEPLLSVRVPKALRDRIYREAAAIGIPASAIVTQALADWYRLHPDGPDKPDTPRVVSLHPIDESGQRRLLLACGWPPAAVRAVMEQKRNEYQWSALLINARLTSGKEELRQWDQYDLDLLDHMGLKVS